MSEHMTWITTDSIPALDTGDLDALNAAVEELDAEPVEPVAGEVYAS